MASSSDNSISSQNADGTVVEIVQPQVAVVALDDNSGQMKAIVGGRTAPTAQKQLNRAYQSSMPIGSTIKPIAVYGPAFDAGASPGSVVADMPVAIQGWGGRGYPNNYSMGFSGMTTIRTGLRNSSERRRLPCAGRLGRRGDERQRSSEHGCGGKPHQPRPVRSRAGYVRS